MAHEELKSDPLDLVLAREERQEILEGEFDILPTPEEEHEAELARRIVQRYREEFVPVLHHQ